MRASRTQRATPNIAGGRQGEGPAGRRTTCEDRPLVPVRLAGLRHGDDDLAAWRLVAVIDANQRSRSALSGWVSASGRIRGFGSMGIRRSAASARMSSSRAAWPSTCLYHHAAEGLATGRDGWAHDRAGVGQTARTYPRYAAMRPTMHAPSAPSSSPLVISPPQTFSIAKPGSYRRPNQTPGSGAGRSSGERFSFGSPHRDR